jgi:hypothetical protein
MYKRNIYARSRNNCYRGRAISVTYSVCVSVALVIQHTKRMCHIVPCDLSDSRIPFPHYLINGTVFFKKEVTEHITCVLILSTNFYQRVLILISIQRNIILNIRTFLYKVPVILVRF